MKLLIIGTLSVLSFFLYGMEEMPEGYCMQLKMIIAESHPTGLQHAFESIQKDDKYSISDDQWLNLTECANTVCTYRYNNLQYKKEHASIKYPLTTCALGFGLILWGLADSILSLLYTPSDMQSAIVGITMGTCIVLPTCGLNLIIHSVTAKSLQKKIR